MSTNSHTISNAGYAKGFTELSQEEKDQCKKILSIDGVKAYESFLRNKTDEWKTVSLNIGVIGCSGAGKSSFINAVRDLDGDDEGAANVGVTETQMEPTPYSHPNNEMMKFWDLPGVGTNLFPRESYLEKIGFDRFDFFLILAHVRFTELDAWLSQEIRNKGKQFFFVRTKIQCDIDNDRRAHPKRHKNDSKAITEGLLHQMRVNLQENLKDLYQEKNVFLIDNYERNKYDFSLLTQRLVEEFPELKRQAFIFSMNAFSEQMVQAKVQELRSTMWKSASLSALVAAVPVAGLSFAVDLVVIMNMSEFFFDQLGLDEASLEKMAYITKTDPMMLKNIVEENLDMKKFLTSQGIKELLVSLPAIAVSEAAEEVFRLIPVFGSLIAAPISFGTTYYILNHILDKIEEVTLLVVRTAAQSVSVNVADDEQPSHESIISKETL
jgi:predicted GTPase